MINQEDVKFTNQGSIKKIELLKNIIKFILSKREPLGKTEIVKICFLIDKQYAVEKKNPEGISTTTYVKYFYGPYSVAFPDALEQLEQEGWIKNETESPLLHKYRYFLKKRLDEEGKFSQDEIKIIENTLKLVKGKNLSEIKKIVYSIKEVKEAEFGKEIKLIRSDDNGLSFSRMENKR